MGNSNSTPATDAGAKIDAAVNKASAKTDKVLKSVSGTINSTASDVKKTVNKATDKTTTNVNKAASDVSKAINQALQGTDTKKKANDDDDKHLKQVALALPIVALVIAGGVYLWQHKPWKKSGGAGGGKPAKPAAAK